MMDEYYQAAFTLKGLRSGPCLDGFARNLDCEGYGWWTVRRYLIGLWKTDCAPSLKSTNCRRIRWVPIFGCEFLSTYYHAATCC